MATIKDTLILEDRMSQTIKAVQTALDHASASTKIAKTEMEQMKKTYGETSIECAKATMKWSQQAEKVEKLQDKLENLNKTSNKSKTGLIAIGSFLGTIGANLAMRAFDGLKNSIGQAIERASDLQEVQNVVDVTFGNSAEIINKWSRNTLNQFGLNELSAKKFSGTMGAMLKSSGLTGNSVMEMSQKITELTGDMASFYNLNAEEAFMKLRSGISGETEPLKQLGINMSVANLEAFALAQGITKTYNKMSQAEQMTLRYNYLLKATADAQGDFARTSDSFANQQKLLQENWSNLTSSIAENFLPIMAQSMVYLNKFIVFIGPVLQTAIENLVISFFAVQKAFHNVGVAFINVGKSIYNGYANIVNGIIGYFQNLFNFITNWITVIASILDKVFKTDLSDKIREFQTSINKEMEKSKKIKKAYSEFSKSDSVEKALVFLNKEKNLEKGNKATNDLLKFADGSALKTKQQGKIELKEEDVKMLNELATRDFMVRYQSLSPQVTFGNVTVNETADFNQVLGQLDTWVEEKANNSLSVGVGK